MRKLRADKPRRQKEKSWKYISISIIFSWILKKKWKSYEIYSKEQIQYLKLIRSSLRDSTGSTSPSNTPLLLSPFHHALSFMNFESLLVHEILNTFWEDTNLLKWPLPVGWAGKLSGQGKGNRLGELSPTQSVGNRLNELDPTYTPGPSGSWGVRMAFTRVWVCVETLCEGGDARCGSVSVWVRSV